MKVFILTFGGNCPSTHYRFLQYGKLFCADDFSIDHKIAKDFNDWALLPNYDLIILQKTVLSSEKVKKIAKLAKRFIYDTDDRIWLRPFKKHSFFSRIRNNYRMQKICQSADLCMVANNVIANDIRKFGGTPNIIPMGLNGDVWYPKKTASEEVVIGWTGAPVNLLFLENILKPLK